MPAGSRVLVGFSGGADSTCLVHLLHGEGYEIVAAHLNHGMRPEAADEAAQCQKWCESLGIGFALGNADIPRLSREQGLGVEEAGRDARYHFFDRASRQMDCVLIATAHTADDQAETVLLNITRGAGLTGLAGIPRRRGRIVRPLLPFSRAETQAYCEEHGLLVLHDPANDDIQFSRARIRHRVIPELQQINGSVQHALNRLSRLAADESRFLEGQAVSMLERAHLTPNGPLDFLTADCEVLFDRLAFEQTPAVLIRRAIRLIAQTLGAVASFDQVSAIEAMLEEEESGSVTFTDGEVVAEIGPKDIHFRVLQVDEPYKYPLTVPGETISDEFGWMFIAHEDSRREDPKPLHTQLDLSVLKGGLHFRTAEPGDRMIVHTKEEKVNDLMAKAGLTVSARRRLPIICDMVGPIWIPSVAVAARAEPKPESTRALSVSFGPLGPPPAAIMGSERFAQR